MPTNHNAKLAFPISSAANQTQARNLCVKRIPYALADNEDSRDLVAVDPDTGSIIEDIVFLGRVFHYWSTDTTSVHDGVTVLVSFDGKRYRLASGTDAFAYSVKSILSTPPGSPAIGDAYLIGSSPTGAWSGHADAVTIYTSRGWEFITFGTGRLLHVESSTNYYHRDVGGTWTAGLGTLTIGANLIPASSLIGRPVRWIVVNQTTNAPPDTSPGPSIGEAYIIGTAPTGAWSGHAGKIAICESGDTFTIYAPRDGELAYDDALNADYRYNLATTSWISSAGAIVGNPVSQFTTTGSTTTGGTGSAAYSATVAPTTSLTYVEDSVTITYAARRSGARLRFHYQFVTNDATAHVLGLYRDSEANAVDWVRMNGGPTVDSYSFIFEVTTADASSHVYKTRQTEDGSGGVAAYTRRRFSVEEFA